jgi:hypothetical protein
MLQTRDKKKKLVIIFKNIASNRSTESFSGVTRDQAMNIVRRRQVNNIASASWGSDDLDISLIRAVEGRGRQFLEKLPSVRTIMKGLDKFRHLA